jgi:hypothetical protein
LNGTRPNCSDSTVSRSLSASDFIKNGGFEKSCVPQNPPLYHDERDSFDSPPP